MVTKVERGAKYSFQMLGLFKSEHSFIHGVIKMTIHTQYKLFYENLIIKQLSVNKKYNWEF